MKKRHHGEIRRSQLVRTFGPGAMVDLPSHSVVVSGLDSWFPAAAMPTIVEERLSLKTDEQRETFRTSIRKIYGQKISLDPNYDFMDNLELVKAVTDVRLKSDIAGAGSLIGALANRTNEENQKLYDRMIDTMLNKLGYCRTCAQKTIEYFCTQEDES